MCATKVFVFTWIYQDYTKKCSVFYCAPNKNFVDMEVCLVWHSVWVGEHKCKHSAITQHYTELFFRTSYRISHSRACSLFLIFLLVRKTQHLFIVHPALNQMRPLLIWYSIREKIHVSNFPTYWALLLFINYSLIVYDIHFGSVYRIFMLLAIDSLVTSTTVIENVNR